MAYQHILESRPGMRRLFTVTKQHSLYVHKIKGKTRVAEQVEVLRGSSKKNDVWTLSQRFCFVVKANSKQTLKIKQ
jgi:hypothetical protein